MTLLEILIEVGLGEKADASDPGYQLLTILKDLPDSSVETLAVMARHLRDKSR